mmetsp:Transcript_15676/g.28157  ORF Transcript_15676/g.28157 Transcript_15676/m.28157 type:complete len:236 (+) Transcript_15676:1219-1926(+)
MVVYRCDGFACVGGQFGQGLSRRDGGRVIAGVLGGWREVREVDVRQVRGDIQIQKFRAEGGWLGQGEEEVHVAVEDVCVLHGALGHVQKPLDHLVEARPVVEHARVRKARGHPRYQRDRRVPHLGHRPQRAHLHDRATDERARLPPVRPQRHRGLQCGLPLGPLRRGRDRLQERQGGGGVLAEEIDQHCRPRTQAVVLGRDILAVQHRALVQREPGPHQRPRHHRSQLPPSLCLR